MQCKRVFGLRQNGKIDGGDGMEGMAMGTKQGEGVAKEVETTVGALNVKP